MKEWFEKHLWTIPVLTGLVTLLAIIAIGFIGMSVYPSFLKDYNESFSGISTGVSAVIAAILAGIVIMQTIATRKQAETSTKMAEEMREQRLTVSQPLLFPDFKKVKLPDRKMVSFRNLGSGPALNIRVRFAYADADKIKREWIARTGPTYSMAIIDNPNWTILETGCAIHCEPSLAGSNQGNIGTAFAEYSDIYGRQFLSGWEYSYEKDTDDHIVLQPTRPVYPIIRESEKDD